MTAPMLLPRAPDHARFWHLAQAAGLLLTGLLLAGLVLQPDRALNILWNAVVPVLPAVFLVSPAIWRNVCPLATLTLMPRGRHAHRTLSPAAVRTALVAGVLLLVILVPARRFLFNTDGLALGITIAAVAVVSLIGGTLFKRKAGFCNSICPVLPVERLYGQRPLLRLPNVRCVPCAGCTERGCLDLSPADSAQTGVGERWSSSWWTLSPFGAFAAAFPGFVIGYYTIANGPLTTAGAVYSQVLIAMVVSWGIVTVASRLAGVAAAAALPALAVLAFGLYYWFAAEVISNAWGLGVGMMWGLRVVAFSLLLIWLVARRPAAEVFPGHA